MSRSILAQSGLFHCFPEIAASFVAHPPLFQKGFVVVGAEFLECSHPDSLLPIVGFVGRFGWRDKGVQVGLPVAHHLLEEIDRRVLLEIRLARGGVLPRESLRLNDDLIEQGKVGPIGGVKFDQVLGQEPQQVVVFP